ncbi:MAG: helix-turn-helix domain-containing protein, partial [Candidatus Paceibacterota bacterium]
MLSVAKLLKAERQKKELSLSDVQKETRIRKKYLTAVEAGDWNAFPSMTYIQGVIKTYAKFLGLDGKKLLAFFRREYEKKERISFKKRISKDSFTPQTKKLLAATIFTIILIFGGYFLYQLNIYFSPPNVEILKPVKDTSRQDKIELVGQTEKEAIVEVNSKRVYLDEQNRFSTNI